MRRAESFLGNGDSMCKGPVAGKKAHTAEEGKEGPGTRLKRERGANSTEMMLLTTAGADSLLSEEFNTTLSSVTETYFTEHQWPKVKLLLSEKENGNASKLGKLGEAHIVTLAAANKSFALCLFLNAKN